MAKIIFRKNQYVTSREQAVELLTAMDDFINNPVVGKPQPRVAPVLMNIWNNGQWLEWEWSGETQAEYERRKQSEKFMAEELSMFKTDNESWKRIIIRSWRNEKLRTWIDDTFVRPLLYNLTTEQDAERIEKRQKLLDWPALPELNSYKTDIELDTLKPDPPSWISG